MAPTTTTVATKNETCHGAPSTLPSNPCPREGKDKGNESKDGNAIVAATINRRHCQQRRHRRHWLNLTAAVVNNKRYPRR
jgi:hypothetical protein